MPRPAATPVQSLEAQAEARIARHDGAVVCAAGRGGPTGPRPGPPRRRHHPGHHGPEGRREDAEHGPGAPGDRVPDLRHRRRQVPRHRPGLAGPGGGRGRDPRRLRRQGRVLQPHQRDRVGVSRAADERRRRRRAAGARRRRPGGLCDRRHPAHARAQRGAAFLRRQEGAVRPHPAVPRAQPAMAGQDVQQARRHGRVLAPDSPVLRAAGLHPRGLRHEACQGPVAARAHPERHLVAQRPG
ncbi:hypothetical protein FOCC_FOCC000162 [Frankliniella occidentalis]|nr:hypothetical protein FOCC_FOCC000162 [Frankliniella occidentalis]